MEEKKKGATEPKSQPAEKKAAGKPEATKPAAAKAPTGSQTKRN
jgi:hypothetical protein